jgi:hypothetical protein
MRYKKIWEGKIAPAGSNFAQKTYHYFVSEEQQVDDPRGPVAPVDQLVTIVTLKLGRYRTGPVHVKFEESKEYGIIVHDNAQA